MKSIVFGIIVLLALQGCSYVGEAFSSRSINSCSQGYNSKGHPIPINKKQCKKDKETLTNILGKGGLEAENKRRDLIVYEVYYSPLLILSVVGASL